MKKVKAKRNAAQSEPAPLIDKAIRDELDRIMPAKIVSHDPAEMVYQPLLSGLSTGGFYHDPKEVSEMLDRHFPNTPTRYRTCAFATNPETCQSLTLDDLIESAAQDMYEDWYELVTDKCAEEIKIVQSTLDALHMRLCDFPAFRVDYSRVVLLPVPGSSL